MRGESDGAVARIGFLGHAAVVRQATAATATDLATVITLANALKLAATNLGLTT
jgi:allantoicase